MVVMGWLALFIVLWCMAVICCPSFSPLFSVVLGCSCLFVGVHCCCVCHGLFGVVPGCVRVLCLVYVCWLHVRVCVCVWYWYCMVVVCRLVVGV